MSLSHTLHTLASDVYHCLSSWTDGKPYHYVNWWNDSGEFWIADFITHHFPEHPAVTFFSCLEGRRRRFARFYRGRKIFFSGENLQEGGLIDTRQNFRDHRISEVDLAVGFELRQEAKYYRFPLWVCYFFSPSDTLEEIRAKIAAFNDPQLRLSAGRTLFASLVASHDPSGMRADLLELLEPIAHVDSAGRFRKNTNAL